jgi:hypothetical protein
MYDASLGRFMTLDPMAEEPHNILLTPYHYCNNNPILFIDINGEDWWVGSDGALVYKKGTDVNPLEDEDIQNTEDSQYIHLGGDDYFGEDAVGDDTEYMFMSPGSAEDFANENGFEKGTEEIVESVEIDMWDVEGSGIEHTTAQLNDEVISSKVTYIKPENSGDYEKKGFRTESDGFTRQNITTVKRWGVDGQEWPKKTSTWNLSSTGRNKYEKIEKKDYVTPTIKWGKLIHDFVKAVR